MMNKYGVSDICPHCGTKVEVHHAKMGDGTEQENIKCPQCGYETVHTISEPSAGDSRPE